MNLEAQACGTPVITYRTGGSPESVPEENVVDTGNVNGLLGLIHNICGEVNPARVYDTDVYDRKKLYQKYLEAYSNK